MVRVADPDGGLARGTSTLWSAGRRVPSPVLNENPRPEEEKTFRRSTKDLGGV